MSWYVQVFWRQQHYIIYQLTVPINLTQYYHMQQKSWIPGQQPAGGHTSCSVLNINKRYIHFMSCWIHPHCRVLSTPLCLAEGTRTAESSVPHYVLLKGPELQLVSSVCHYAVLKGSALQCPQYPTMPCWRAQHCSVLSTPLCRAEGARTAVSSVPHKAVLKGPALQCQHYSCFLLLSLLLL